MPEQNRSLGCVAAIQLLVVAYFGWGFFAADFVQNDLSAIHGETNFWVNSVVQLPNVFGVIIYAFQNRFWVFVLIISGELLVLILWSVMKKLEWESGRR